MTDGERLEAAEADVERTREALIGTLRELTHQFEPHRLVREMWEDAKDKGADLAENAVDAVRARPLASTGVVAAVAMFLAREPLMELAGKLAGRKKKTGGKPSKRNQTGQK
jgi:hypothetical protein